MYGISDKAKANNRRTDREDHIGKGVILAIGTLVNIDNRRENYVSA